MAVEQIERLEIKGFKSIREMSLDLRPLNVLIGANGAGKSNFIEFFRMLNFAFGSTLGDLQLYIGRKGKASSLLHYGPQTSRNIDAAIRFSGDRQWSKYSFSLSWGAPDELFYASELLEYQREDKDPVIRSKQLGHSHVESRVLKEATGSNNLGIQMVARVFRDRLRQIRAYHFHDTSDDANIRITQDRDRDHFLMNNGGNLAVFLQNLKEDRPEHYRRILSTVQLVAPFLRDFELGSEPLNPRFVMLRWRDRSGNIFGPHQLSDGTLRAIAVISALLQPEETLPSIMLFDEPELGLHPAAIGMVATLLKAVSLKRQVIVATQSPRLLADLCPEDIIVVERREEAGGYGHSVFNRLSKEELGAWLDDYDLGALYEMNVTGGGPQ